MRVIHIIPSAFDYFDDIRAAAFEVVEKSALFGIEAEAFTLQFTSGIATKTKEAIQSAAPSREFVGMNSIEELIAALDDFDLVHLHVPFLGAGSLLVRWRQLHPDVPFFITYYRPVPWTDMFSIFVILYNRYYLSKLCARASVVVFQPLNSSMLPLRNVDMVHIDATAHMYDVNLTEIFKEVQLEESDYVTAKYALLYQQLCHPEHPSQG